jgi:phosphatidylethanolamine-binding protein (PEBP) family uncharacterized protein
MSSTRQSNRNMSFRNTFFSLIALLTGGSAMAMEISSTAFGPGAAIPRRYTCEGNDVSPPLQWRGVPTGARSLVLIVDDPDAPDPRAPKMTWVHWVLANLPVDSGGLSEGIVPAHPSAGIATFTSCTRWTSCSTASSTRPGRRWKRR